MTLKDYPHDPEFVLSRRYRSPLRAPGMSVPFAAGTLTLTRAWSIRGRRGRGGWAIARSPGGNCSLGSRRRLNYPAKVTEPKIAMVQGYAPPAIGRQGPGQRRGRRRDCRCFQRSHNTRIIPRA